MKRINGNKPEWSGLAILNNKTKTPYELQPRRGFVVHTHRYANLVHSIVIITWVKEIFNGSFIFCVFFSISLMDLISG